MHKNVTLNFNCEGNGKNDYLREVDTVVLSLPKHDGNVPNKKSVKRLSSFTCSKRPRIDQAGNSLNAGTHDDETTSKEPGPDWIHRMSSGIKKPVLPFIIAHTLHVYLFQ